MTTNARLRKSDVAPAPQWGGFVEFSTNCPHRSEHERWPSRGAGLRRRSNGRAVRRRNPGQPWRLFQISTTTDRCSFAARAEATSDAARRWSRARPRSPPRPAALATLTSSPRWRMRRSFLGQAVRLDAAHACGVRDDAEPPPLRAARDRGIDNPSRRGEPVRAKAADSSRDRYHQGRGTVASQTWNVSPPRRAAWAGQAPSFG